MKKDTCRLFIYICLTTIVANISAYEPYVTCESSVEKVITQYLQDRTKSNEKCNTVHEKLPEFNGATFDLYLCATIRDTVNKICKLNATLKLNSTEFEAQMTNLQKEMKTVSDIAANLTASISNPSYKERIDAIPKLLSTAVLNDHLGPQSSKITCRNLNFDSLSDPYNPLCSILLWANRALIDTKISPNKTTTVDTTISVGTKESPLKNSTTKTVAPIVMDQKPKQNLSSTVKEGKGQPKEQKVIQQTDLSDKASQVNKITQSQVVPNKAEHPEQTSKPENIGDPGVSGQQQEPVGKVESTLKGTDEKSKGIAQSSNSTKKVDKKINKSEKINVDVKQTTQESATLSDNTDNDQPKLVQPQDEVSDDDKENEEIPVESIDPSHNENNVPKNQGSSYPISSDPDNEPPQHFFAYFMAVSLMCLICYVGYHKKHKIMGIIFEGRKSRGGRGRRRPNTAGYRKLDCTLEEAVTSQCNSNVTHVIY